MDSSAMVHAVLRRALSSVMLCWGFVAALAPAGCSAPAPAKPPSSAAPVPPPSPPTLREQLAALLPQNRPAPIVGVLPGPIHQNLESLLGYLSPKERATLAAPGSDLVEHRPLLHLMAGGNSPDAFYLLAVTPRGSEELGRDSEPAELFTMVPIANRLVRSAGEHWLWQAGEQLASEAELDLSFCQRLLDVLAIHGSLDALRLAGQLCEEWQDTPESRLIQARALYLAGAELVEVGVHIDRALQQSAPEALVHGRAGRMREQLVAQGGTAELDAVWQELALVGSGVRRGPLRSVGKLNARIEQEPQHLGLVVAHLLSEHEAITCPEVIGALGTPPMCAEAVRRFLFAEEGYRALQSAWASGQGRTPPAIEHYLGLHLVLPWLVKSGGTGAGAEELTQAVMQFADEHKAHWAELESLGAFAKVIEQGSLAQQRVQRGESAAVPAEAQMELLEVGARRIEQAPRSPFAQAALLSAIAVAAHHRDVRPVATRLFEVPELHYRASLVSLTAWLAAAWQDKALLQKAQEAALVLFSALPEGSYERSALVLLLAEAEFSADPNGATGAALATVAKALAAPGVPPELALRAALDRASVLESAGAKQGAAELLGQLSELARSVPANHPLRGMAAVVLARHWLLTTADKNSSAFTALFGEERLPSGVTFYRDAWVAELEHQGRSEQCGTPACKQRSLAQRNRELKAHAEKLGELPRKLTLRGVMTTGSIAMSLGYEPWTGLVPQVFAFPELVFVPYPEP